MTVIKRTAAALVFLLAVVGLLLSLAAGVGVWVVKDPATAKAAHVFERVEEALDLADKKLDLVKKSLARAAERLNEVREKQKSLALDSGPGDNMRRFLVQTVQQSLAPELGDMNETLHKVAEASVVVNSVLEDVGNFPFLAEAGLDIGQLTDLNDQLAKVGPAAWELGRLLGGASKQSDLAAADRRETGIDQILQSMKGFIAKFEPELAQVRERTAKLKSSTLPWITYAAAGVSVVCFWIALSQVSLLCHACSWWKHAGRS
jgi:hypothetical protein